MQAFQLTPSGMDSVIDAGDLLPITNRTSPYFWWMRRGMSDHCGSLVIRRERNGGHALSFCRDDIRAGPQRRNVAAGQIYPRNTGLAIDGFRENDLARRFPIQPGRRRGNSGSHITCITSTGGYRKNVATDRSLIAHQAADERDCLAVRRPAWHRHLQGGLVYPLKFAEI